MKNFVLGLGAVVFALAAVVAGRVLLLDPAPVAEASPALMAVDAAAAAERLAGAIRIPTVTRNERDRVDWSQWPKLHDYLRRQFPHVDAALTHETVAQYSLLYRWQGSDANAQPILLLAHQDVVPIEPGTESAWEHPPFAGAIAEGYVWGRGALDDKGSLVAQFEAVELLLASGFTPKRTIYFAFGHDEEIGGEQGAKQVAALLASRGVKAEFSLDEGGAITQGIVAGVARPVASIMTAEKGYLSLKLTAHDAGGHSSRPPRITAIGRIATAIARLQAEPLPARLGPPVTDMLDRLAPVMSPMLRLAVANRWLFGPLVEKRMTASSTTNALVRTTTAPTIFRAGVKDNVLPVEAEATVNFRILPGDSIASVTAQVRRIIDDPEVELLPCDFFSEPSPVSPVDTPAFAAIERASQKVFPEAVVAPGLVIGATDNRHYGAVRDARYNYVPVMLTEPDLNRLHGANERIGVPDYARLVQFYAQLLRDTAG